jgi:hypothetical protein
MSGMCVMFLLQCNYSELEVCCELNVTVSAPVNSAKWSVEWNAFILQDNENVRWLRPGERSKGASKFVTTDSSIGPSFSTQSTTIHEGIVWDLDVSRFIPFSASAGSDGLVRVSNLNRMNQRSYKPVLVTLYQIQRDDGDEELGFYYKDGIYQII